LSKVERESTERGRRKKEKKKRDTAVQREREDAGAIGDRRDRWKFEEFVLG